MPHSGGFNYKHIQSKVNDIKIYFRIFSMQLCYTQNVSFQLPSQFILLLPGVSAAHRSLLHRATSIKKSVQRAMKFVKYK